MALAAWPYFDNAHSLGTLLCAHIFIQHYLRPSIVSLYESRWSVPQFWLWMSTWAPFWVERPHKLGPVRIKVGTTRLRYQKDTGLEGEWDHIGLPWQKIIPDFQFKCVILMYLSSLVRKLMWFARPICILLYKGIKGLHI